MNRKSNRKTRNTHIWSTEMSNTGKRRKTQKNILKAIVGKTPGQPGAKRALWYN